MSTKFEFNLIKVVHNTTHNPAPAATPPGPSFRPGGWKAWVKWGSRIVRYGIKLALMIHGIDGETLDFLVQVAPIFEPVDSWIEQILEK